MSDVMQQKSRGAKTPKPNVVVVQPNIDPYNEKFSGGNVPEQIGKMIRLSEQEIDNNTRLVVWPETAIPDYIYEHQFAQHPTIQALKQFVARHPNLKLLTGTSSLVMYDEKTRELPSTARPFTDGPGHYDVFNTAILLDTTDNIQIYHKSKLVPGVETLPWFLAPLAIDLGGPAGFMGKQDSAGVFRVNDELVAAPVICYESIFGDYVGDYINKGANLITIITNDGWWRNTPGYKQHRDYAVLRAIETRRMIARSANTGVSCFISPDGTISQETGWWVPAVIKSDVVLNNEITFYVRHGDYIAYILEWPGIILLIIGLFGGLYNRFSSRGRKAEGETGM